MTFYFAVRANTVRLHVHNPLREKLFVTLCVPMCMVPIEVKQWRSIFVNAGLSHNTVCIRAEIDIRGVRKSWQTSMHSLRICHISYHFCLDIIIFECIPIRITLVEILREATSRIVLSLIPHISSVIIVSVILHPGIISAAEPI